MVTLLELLRNRGLPPDAGVKLARHRDSRYEIDRIVEAGFFEHYQSWQARQVFGDCKEAESDRPRGVCVARGPVAVGVGVAC